MHWILYAVLATILYSCNSLLDKHLIDRHFKYLNALTITSLAGIAGLPFITLLLIIGRQVPDPKTLLYGFIAGWLVLFAYQLYYKALKRADASLVVTLFQFILPFNYLFGMIFLDEQLAIKQVAGLLLIIIAATFTSIEEKEGKWRFQLQVIVLMIFASLLISMSDLIFKSVVESKPFLEIATAEYLSTVVAGFLIFFTVPSVRSNIYKMRSIYKKLFLLSETNEFFTFTGSLATRYAISLGPIALVQGVMGAQPIIVLVMARVLAFFMPQLQQHTKKPRHRLTVEILSMGIVVIGGFLISQ